MTPTRRGPGGALRIAIVAWGSLLWDQRTLKLSSRWYADGPGLPLEFARASENGRLTLVLHEDSPLQQTYWATSSFDSLGGARENLRARERCTTVAPIHVHTRSGKTHGEVPESVKRRMAAWLSEHTGVDAVVWTGLQPKWPGRTPFGVEAAIAYLQSLEEPARSRAREYVTKAPPQIQTPVRQRVRQSLGWKDHPLPANTLEAPDAQASDNLRRGPSDLQSR